MSTVLLISALTHLRPLSFQAYIKNLRCLRSKVLRKVDGEVANIGETGNSERKQTLKPELCVQAATLLALPPPLSTAPWPCTVRSSYPNPSQTWEQMSEGAGGAACGEQASSKLSLGPGAGDTTLLHPEKSWAVGAGTPPAPGRRFSDQSSYPTRARTEPGRQILPWAALRCKGRNCPLLRPS